MDDPVTISREKGVVFLTKALALTAHAHTYIYTHVILFSTYTSFYICILLDFYQNT